MIQVIIPTYNRSTSIQFLLRDCIYVYHGNLFDFLILDSSTNNETECLTKQSDKIVYKRCDSSVTADEKVINAILECRYEYYWLLGDGNLVDFNTLENLIMKIHDYDVLEIECASSKRNVEQVVDSFTKQNNLLEYIKVHYTYLTYWGSAIIKTSKAKGLLASGILDKYLVDKTSWWCAALVCEMIVNDIAKRNSTKIVTLFSRCIYENPSKIERGWVCGESYFLITFRIFDKDVEILPKYFDSIKVEIIRNFRDDVLASKRYLIHLKRIGVIKLKYILKYKKDIQDVPGYYAFMLMLAIIPQKIFNCIYEFMKLLLPVCALRI